MKTVTIFTRDSCPRCPGAKDLGARLQRRDVPVTYYDVATAEGLAEATFLRVLATPAILIVEEERVIAAWRGVVPDENEVLHGLA
jgi:glutaredoxin